MTRHRSALFAAALAAALPALPASAQQTPAGAPTPSPAAGAPAANAANPATPAGSAGAAANPASPAGATAAGAQAAGLPPMPRHSWTTDRRRFVEGDLITVLVDEYTLASTDRVNTAVADRSTRGGLSGAFSTGKPGGTSVSGALSSSWDTDSRQRGESTHHNRITSEITVRVTKVEPSGIMHVEGRKAMKIDRNEQTVIVSGLLRPEDVTPQNVVDSFRLADARIETVPDKKLGEPKKGIISKILGMLWP